MAIPPQFLKKGSSKTVPMPTPTAKDGLPSGLIPNKKSAPKQSANDKKKAFLKNALKKGGF